MKILGFPWVFHGFSMVFHGFLLLAPPFFGRQRLHGLRSSTCTSWTSAKPKTASTGWMAIGERVTGAGGAWGTGDFVFWNW